MKKQILLTFLGLALSQPLSAAVVDFDGSRVQFYGLASTSIKGKSIIFEIITAWKNRSGKPLVISGDPNGYPAQAHLTYAAPDGHMTYAWLNLRPKNGKSAVEDLKLRPDKKATRRYIAQYDHTELPRGGQFYLVLNARAYDAKGRYASEKHIPVSLTNGTLQGPASRRRLTR